MSSSRALSSLSSSIITPQGGQIVQPGADSADGTIVQSSGTFSSRVRKPFKRPQTVGQQPVQSRAKPSREIDEFDEIENQADIGDGELPKAAVLVLHSQRTMNKAGAEKRSIDSSNKTLETQVSEEPPQKRRRIVYPSSVSRLQDQIVAGRSPASATSVQPKTPAWSNPAPSLPTPESLESPSAVQRRRVTQALGNDNRFSPLVDWAEDEISEIGVHSDGDTDDDDDDDDDDDGEEHEEDEETGGVAVNILDCPDDDEIGDTEQEELEDLVGDSKEAGESDSDSEDDTNAVNRPIELSEKGRGKQPARRSKTPKGKGGKHGSSKARKTSRKTQSRPWTLSEMHSIDFGQPMTSSQRRTIHVDSVELAELDQLVYDAIEERFNQAGKFFTPEGTHMRLSSVVLLRSLGPRKVYNLWIKYTEAYKRIAVLRHPFDSKVFLDLPAPTDDELNRSALYISHPVPEDPNEQAGLYGGSGTAEKGRKGFGNRAQGYCVSRQRVDNGFGKSIADLKSAHLNMALRPDVRWHMRIVSSFPPSFPRAISLLLEGVLVDVRQMLTSKLPASGNTPWQNPEAVAESRSTVPPSRRVVDYVQLNGASPFAQGMNGTFIALRQLRYREQEGKCACCQKPLSEPDAWNCRSSGARYHPSSIPCLPQGVHIHANCSIQWRKRMRAMKGEEPDKIMESAREFCRAASVRKPRLDVASWWRDLAVAQGRADADQLPRSGSEDFERHGEIAQHEVTQVQDFECPACNVRHIDNDLPTNGSSSVKTTVWVTVKKANDRRKHGNGFTFVHADGSSSVKTAVWVPNTVPGLREASGFAFIDEQCRDSWEAQLKREEITVEQWLLKRRHKADLVKTRATKHVNSVPIPANFDLAHLKEVQDYQCPACLRRFPDMTEKPPAGYKNATYFDRWTDNNIAGLKESTGFKYVDGRCGRSWNESKAKESATDLAIALWLQQRQRTSSRKDASKNKADTSEHRLLVKLPIAAPIDLFP